MQLAVALYNNNVEDEDELEFRKGDILTVLIENPNGFDGWWLCKNKDKYGLCPGNRLKLIQNAASSPIKLNDYLHNRSRISTASMYDDLSKNYDNTVTSSSSNYEYDNSSSSNFIFHSKALDVSPESSICSSGIYSTNDLHLSSSSSLSDSYTISTNSNSLSAIDLDRLRDSFQKLSIRSSILDKYCQLTLKTNIKSIIDSFISECYLFLHNYGCLLDRSTYRLIKENYLQELKFRKKQAIVVSTKIIQLIKSIVDLQLQKKSLNNSSISNDVFKKLHLEPIAEIPHEKLTTSLSATEIYENLPNENPQTQMKTSKTCYSILLSSSSSILSHNHAGIDDIDSKNSLIQCYYRHINEQVNSIMKRFSYLLDNQNNISSLTADGKAFIVAAHKLIFVLETLHEHVQQIHTSLIHLTTQLCEALKNFIQLLKEFGQNISKNIQIYIIRYQSNIKMIMNIIQKIRKRCSLC